MQGEPDGWADGDAETLMRLLRESDAKPAQAKKLAMAAVIKCAEEGRGIPDDVAALIPLESGRESTHGYDSRRETIEGAKAGKPSAMNQAFDFADDAELGSEPLFATERSVASSGACE